MRRLELGCVLLGLAVSAGAVEPAFRYRAPITVQQPAAFVQLPLPASAYGRSLQAGLDDLRVVDSRGERVPFALLAPRASLTQDVEQQRDAVLYPLPRKPAAGQPWASPVEVVVQGERISVKPIFSRRLAGKAAAPADSPGWLIDLGERARDEPSPQSLRLAWSGPAEFSAAFVFEVSDDLRRWRAGGNGQLMALSSATGPLTQPSVVLPADAARFVRLVWLDPAAAPVLTGARLVAARQRSVALDPPAELEFSASPEPPGQAGKGALHFDLGGALPLVQLDLQLAPGTHIAPVRVQVRSRIDEPWRELAQAVFYRLERGGAASRSPPIELRATLRYLRIVADERSAPLDAGQTRLLVQAQLASLVFANQGQAPFSLLAGASDARPGALPSGVLVPALDDERPRFGRASLGEWHEVAAVARQLEADQRQAALRPWLLWGVLVAGVLGLSAMVWRLARKRG